VADHCAYDIKLPDFVKLGKSID